METGLRYKAYFILIMLLNVGFCHSATSKQKQSSKAKFKLTEDQRAKILESLRPKETKKCEVNPEYIRYIEAKTNLNKTDP